MERKSNKKNIILTILIIFFSISLVFSLVHIIFWKVDGDNTIEQMEKIEKIVNVEEVVEENNENIEIIEQEQVIEKMNPYWAYINMSLISVDFSDLKEVNRDTVGWIQVNGTNINYPYVQTTNNEFYLTHSFDKSYNSAGWVFLDYRNKNDLSDRNSIIYAHGRIDNTMFGSLRNALTNGWLDDTNNYIFKISTLTMNTMWQVFSVYKTPPVTDYLKTNFSSDEDFEKFGNMLISRSDYDFGTFISKQDSILTLSTCYDENVRVVLHAKLIKKENR